MCRSVKKKNLSTPSDEFKNWFHLIYEPYKHRLQSSTRIIRWWFVIRPAISIFSLKHFIDAPSAKMLICHCHYSNRMRKSFSELGTLTISIWKLLFEKNLLQVLKFQIGKVIKNLWRPMQKRRRHFWYRYHSHKPRYGCVRCSFHRMYDARKMKQIQ